MQSIVICKRVQGHLLFEAEGIGGLFQNSQIDPKTPIGILSVVGEQSDTFLIKSLVKQLQDNSEFWEPLEKNLMSSIKSRKHSEAQNDPISSSSRVTLWPEAFYYKASSSILIVLVLQVSYSVEDPEFESPDSLEMFLSLASSTILEVSLKKSQPRFRHLHKVLLSQDKLYDEKICKHIVHRKNLNRQAKPNRTLDAKSPNDKTLTEYPTSVAAKINWALGSMSPKIFTGVKHSYLFESNLEEFFKKCIDDCQEVFTQQNESGQERKGIENTRRLQQTTKPQSSIVRSNTHTGIGSSNTTFLESTVPSPDEAEIPPEVIKAPVPKPRSRKNDFKLPQTDSTENNSFEIDDSTTEETEKEINTPFSAAETETMSARGFVQVAAEVVLEKLKPKATKDMLNAVQLLVAESQEVLEKALSSWDINNTAFRCDNLLENVLDKSSSRLSKIQKLESTERKWVLEQAKTQLLESNSDLSEIETILASFVSKNVDASDANALRILINLNVLKNKTLKGHVWQYEGSISLLLAICNNISMTYVHKNKHKDIFLISVEAARNFCFEEFKRYFEEGLYSKSDTRKIVDALMNRCASSIAHVMSWYFKHDLTKSEKVIGSFCKKSCSKLISDFKKQNTNKIIKYHSKLSGIVAKSKSMYDEKIVHDVTRKVSLSKLKGVHEKARSDAIKFLHGRIQREIRDIEPVEIHEKTITAEIDTAWKLLSSSYKG